MFLKQESRRKLGGVLIVLGAMLGVWLFGLSTWAQFEATLFDADLTGNSELPMTCPRFISPDETGYARITLSNPTDHDHSRFMRTHITAGLVTLMREDTRLEPVPAGGTVSLSWPFTAADAVYGGSMVFVRVFVVGRAPLPSASAVCGVYVLPTPFGMRGETFMQLSFALSLALMLAGFWLWRQASPDTRRWRNLRFGVLLLIASIALGMALTLLGEWFFAAIILLVIALLGLALMTPIFLQA